MPFIPDETPVKSPTPGFVPDSASPTAQTYSPAPESSIPDTKSQGIFSYLANGYKSGVMGNVERMKGFLKEAGSFGYRLGELGSSIGGAASDYIDQKRGVGVNEAKIPESTLGRVSHALSTIQNTATQRPEIVTPSNEQQKQGAALENVAEFFIPGPEGKGQVAANIASKFPKAAKVIAPIAKVAKEGAEQAIRGSVAEGGIQDVPENFAIGSLFGAGGQLASTFKKALPNLAKKLETINLRLTPTQKREFAQKADDAATFVLENGIVGNPQKKLETVQNIIETQKEPQLQQFLKETAKDRTVPRQKLLNEMDAIKQSYQDSRDYLAVERQIDEAKSVIERAFPDEVPLDRLNNFKRSTYENAFNKAGDKVLDDVEYAIGDVTRKNIEEATKGLKLDGKDVGEFNREYGRVLNARKFLKAATGRSQLGLIGKFVSSVAAGGLGTAIGGPVGGAIGTVAAPYIAEKVTGTAVRSRVAQAAKSAAKATLPEFEQKVIKGTAASALKKSRQ